MIYWKLLACAVLLYTAANWNGSTAAAHQPRIASVVVDPIIVEAQPYADAPPRRDTEELLRRLGEIATARAERSLIKQQLAGTSTRTSTSTSSEAPVLSGVVRLPISLPRGHGGARALFRRGRFASATVVLKQDGGTVLAEETASLDWDDVRWIYGARGGHARKLDEVLEDYVRKAVDQALKRLRRHLNSPGPSTQDGVQ